jgi:hypothetical protein
MSVASAAYHSTNADRPGQGSLKPLNYVFVRSPYRGIKPKGPRHRPADRQFAVNFGEQADFRGMATTVFVNSFLRHLDMECTPDPLPKWFQELALPIGAKMSLSDNGDEQVVA